MAGGGEVFEETEFGQRIGFVGGGGGGIGVFEIIAEQGDESFDEWAVGVAAEMAVAVTEFTDEPDLRDATGNAVGVGAFGFSEARVSPCAIDDDGESFLRVFDDVEVVEELLLLIGHGEKLTTN